MKSKTIDIPPIPAEITKLIQVGNPESKTLKEDLATVAKYQEKLWKLFETYTKRCENTKIGTENQISPERRPITKPEIIFLKTKLGNIIRKQKLLDIEISGQAAASISLVCFFFNKLVEMSFPAVFDINGFEKLLEEKYVKNKKYNRYTFKIKAIQKKLGEESTWGKYPKFSPTSVVKSLSDAIKFYKADLQFCRPSILDQVLEFTIMNNETPVSIEEVYISICGPPPLKQSKDKRRKIKNTSSMGSFKPFKSNFTPFENFLQKYVNMFEADSTEKCNILRYSAYRFLFDMYCTRTQDLDQSDPDILINARIISILSPNDLNIPPIFFPAENGNKSIRSLIKASPTNKKIVAMLSNLKYLTNPYDIAFMLYYFNNSIEKLGQKISSDVTLAFDDFFVTFVALLSFNLPENAEGIAIMLEKFTFLGYSSLFKHAITSFIAAVDYIRNFDKSEHSVEIETKIQALKRRFTGSQIPMNNSDDSLPTINTFNLNSGNSSGAPSGLSSGALDFGPDSSNSSLIASDKDLSHLKPSKFPDEDIPQPQAQLKSHAQQPQSAPKVKPSPPISEIKPSPVATPSDLFPEQDAFGFGKPKRKGGLKMSALDDNIPQQKQQVAKAKPTPLDLFPDVQNDFLSSPNPLLFPPSIKIAQPKPTPQPQPTLQQQQPKAAPQPKPAPQVSKPAEKKVEPMPADEITGVFPELNSNDFASIDLGNIDINVDVFKDIDLSSLITDLDLNQ